VAQYPSENAGAIMKISARNVLKGTVKKLVQGAVNCEVAIELPGKVEIVSIVTKSSADSLMVGVPHGKRD
jgi:molybdopterin-binding protein